MTDAVKLALIGGFFSSLVPTLTILLTWRSQRNAANDAKELAVLNKTEAIAAREAQNVKIDTVATTVNGHSTEQKRLIVALKDEVSRLSRPGAEATTEQKAGSGTDGVGALVGIDHGVVTVEHPRKAGDTKDDSTAA